ncbi:hypothetical protein [Parvibaculum sp.]|uniref:hypothetical protein n=1 Tax=Parvibaculum sp. TaxID=2024848 RepID=UPI0027361D9A|nr:hypothetical protein [Parvibaculum sp.]MDP3327712.1 hypothetical protein [Parvibaculum sp.]
MDQISPADISRIVILPPVPGATASRSWNVRAYRRGENRFPEESYACTGENAALRTAALLLAGDKVGSRDCLGAAALTETGGRPHAAR